MKIVLAGATGFIGSSLRDTLLERGEELVILTRKTKFPPASARLRYVHWEPSNTARLIPEMDGSNAVMNLAGEGIAERRWTKAQKEKIAESRIHATQTISRSIENARVKPAVLINASAVGYYGSRGSELITEASSAGRGFLPDVCQAWEEEAKRAEGSGVRVVRLRIGIVLGKGGGALRKILPPFKMFAGGWLGTGHQWMSWIAKEDLIRLVIHCLDRPEVKGAVNAVSPEPVTNKVFSLVLAQVLKRPCLVPVPAFALKLLLGEMSDMLLAGQRVLPQKAQASGFQFLYPDIRHALETILR